MTTLYHGSSVQINEFIVPDHGLYLTPHLDWAKHYGDVITTVDVELNNVYVINYKHDIDMDLFDALMDRDYVKITQYIKHLQELGYDAMQTVSDSEMIVIFPKSC